MQIYKCFKVLFIFVGFIMTMSPSLSVMPDEILDDPALEAKARVISKDIRCMVCQNQTIDESNAPLARDLRLLIRERLIAGDNENEVKSYLHDRYGDFIFLNPPFGLHSMLLWFGPVIVLMMIIIIYTKWHLSHKQKSATMDSLMTQNDLSAAERKKLQKLLKDE